MSSDTPNAWWVDELDPDHLDRIAATASGLVAGWCGVSDEHSGGHVAYVSTEELACFFQRALRLRDGAHPVTGEPLPQRPDPAHLLSLLLAAPGDTAGGAAA